jgi:hypothetical protein
MSMKVNEDEHVIDLLQLVILGVDHVDEVEQLVDRLGTSNLVELQSWTERNY